MALRAKARTGRGAEKLAGEIARRRLLGAQEVAVLLQLDGELAQVDRTRNPLEAQLAALGIRRRAQGAGMAPKEFFDQPDAADAGNALEVKGRPADPRIRSLGLESRLLFLQPGKILGLQGDGTDGLDGLVLEVVVALQPFLLDQLVDIRATVATVALGQMRAGRIRGAAMATGQ
jgi:hypothetical protein